MRLVSFCAGELLMMRDERRILLTCVLFLDEPSKYVGAPISLQLVGRRYEEEKLIEALEMITQVAGLPFADA